MKSRKLFLVASIAAVAGVLTTTAVPGCSSTSEVGGDGTDAAVAPFDAKPLPPKEASPDEPVDTGPKTCPNLTDIKESDFTTKWQPPGAITPDCEQPDIDRLKAAFKASTTGVKFTDIKTALGTKCSACVFSPLSTDAGPTTNWSVFVETTATTAIDNRTASCFARLKNDACGKSRNLFEQCLRRACVKEDPAKPELGGCKTDAAVTKCNGAAQNGPCKALTDAYVTACPMESELIASCNIYASIAYSCGGGADGGTIDAAPPP